MAPRGRSPGTIAVNRRARRDYEILETVEAGLVLTGAEIKSVRSGRVNMQEAYAQPRDGELWLVNMHIAEYHGAGGFAPHDPLRDRKLLLHRKQIAHLARRASEHRTTLVPLRIYIKNHYAKVLLAVGRGRRAYDKRAVIAERQSQRDVQRAYRRRA